MSNVSISEAITVPLPEVLSVATLSSKPGGPVDKWCIHYVKKLKGSKLRLTNVTFTGKEEDCVEWTRYVQEHIDKGMCFSRLFPSNTHKQNI